MLFRYGVFALIAGCLSLGAPVDASQAKSTHVLKPHAGKCGASAQVTAQAAANNANAAAGADSSPQTSTKSRRHRGKAARAYRYGAYFIPPPPAYMPSILPELTNHGAVQEADSDKPENPYRKYIYERNGNTPEPAQTRKGVVTWGRSS
jgi:hypothetical protein